MICFVLGVPGSGKTALAVNHIVANKDNDKYQSIFTNINQFKFEKIEKSYPLDWDIFYKHIIDLHALYKTKVTDDVLIEKAQEFNLYKSLIVLDECHNYLDNRDSVLVWWLSYHRHLAQDIFLITQNLALVESKYKAFAEVFYRASPSFLRFQHHILKYTKFIGSRMTQKDKFGVEKLNTKKNDVFSYYKSGDNSKGFNIILKYISIAFLFLFIFLVFAFIYFNSKKNDDIVNDTTNDEKIIVSSNVKDLAVDNSFKRVYEKEEVVYDDSDYVDFVYSNFTCKNSHCTFLNSDIVFKLEHIPQLEKKTNSYFFPVEFNQYTNVVTGYVLSSPILQNMFNRKGLENEKYNTNSSNSVQFPFISK